MIQSTFTVILAESFLTYCNSSLPFSALSDLILTLLCWDWNLVQNKRCKKFSSEEKQADSKQIIHYTFP